MLTQLIELAERGVAAYEREVAVFEVENSTRTAATHFPS